MCGRIFAGVLIAALSVQSALAQTTYPQDKYNYCSAMAAQQSGWSGSEQNPHSKGVVRGGAAGAGAGALIGGMGGGDAGRGAAIGAAFGLVAGEARRQRGAKQVQEQQNAYYNILNACLQQS
jgi:YMGG-like Gly-zipper